MGGRTQLHWSLVIVRKLFDKSGITKWYPPPNVCSPPPVLPEQASRVGRGPHAGIGYPVKVKGRRSTLQKGRGPVQSGIVLVVIVGDVQHLVDDRRLWWGTQLHVEVHRRGWRWGAGCGVCLRGGVKWIASC